MNQDQQRVIEVELTTDDLLDLSDAGRLTLSSGGEAIVLVMGEAVHVDGEGELVA